ncbi:hypothetical protein [Geomonas subterranea]|uniref:hypothetical protein n=1 Tax=Geomonas subterranea TaxID=2847989 RepID=UPI001C456DA3|nr:MULTISPECIES: hypothetical protein [Geomonas]QXM07656.1 hypothetical protein KP002_11655 [Geomonas subterranea]
MHIYRLIELREIHPPALTPLFYGRYLAEVRADGTLFCDNHQFAIDSATPPSPGTKVMIWCSRDYYCCPTEEFKTN